MSSCRYDSRWTWYTGADSARLLAVACLVSYRREVGQVSPKTGKKAKPKKAKPAKKK
jgi:hypothetical protein